MFITAFPPSNLGAGVNYSRQLLIDLSNNHKVDVVYIKGKSEKCYIPNSKNIIIKNYFEITSLDKIFSVLTCPFIFPLFSVKFKISILSYLRKIIKSENYDIIYYDFSQMFLYSSFIKHPNSIFMCHDIIAQRYQRRNIIFGLWARVTEYIILRNKSTIFTFSKKDCRLLSEYYKVKSNYTSFYFNKDVKDASPNSIKPYFVFFAMWKRPDNYEGLEWFIENVYPKINSNFEFKIIGDGLPEYIIKKIEPLKNITYCGFLENPYEIMRNAIALISPLFHGAGVKVKVLDSIAIGLPVIGTTLSFEGIDEDFLKLSKIANDAKEFISAINNCDFSLKDRIALKRLFLRASENKEIIKYINSI